jgi:ABC-type antimicrobial peptide transport system permease subunit
MNIVDPERAAGIYQVVGPSELHSLQLLVRVNDDATPFVSRLRTIVTSVDPSIVLPNPVSLDDVFSEQLWEARLSSVAFVSIALIAVVLSAAGLYALMSFSVSQRTREIAIRTALGASVSRVVYAVVGRAALQLLVGVALGTGVAAAIVPHVLSEFTLRADWRLMLAVVAAAMAVTGLAACAVPTRRALRIQPVQALRDS